VQKDTTAATHYSKKSFITRNLFNEKTTNGTQAVYISQQQLMNKTRNQKRKKVTTTICYLPNLDSDILCMQ
jgi:hypothetical protein